MRQRRATPTILLLACISTGPTAIAAEPGAASATTPSRPIALAVHGGSGLLTRQTLQPELAARYRAGIERALQAGQQVLVGGGSSIEAVATAVKVLEDDPLFNAGKGAVFTNEGRNELDAAIMDGKTGQAGGVAGVTTVKNPVLAARAVMDAGKHVLLSGAGAEKFAAAQRLEIVDPEYFFTQHRWNQLKKAQQQDRLEMDHDGKPATQAALDFPPWQADHKFGTVGAVALDRHGNLAAATSTGGLTNKLYGRIGDSPIVGAGTYADNATAAVSATGVGEFFMRGLVAYDIAARIKYQKLTLSEAVDQTLKNALDDKGGQGGVIALNARGEVKFGFNTAGMFRGYVKDDGNPVVLIFKE